ncbi:hypothetical protein [Streptomyces phaeochromogenes]|uniref:hypothetical protein n=1 Tax=Streptomyces phaeochromogenes TaxID=1923 RepID=UPI0006E1CEFA|nr:hypothetical protein [Streptomyces phaeochromogenes]
MSPVYVPIHRAILVEAAGGDFRVIAAEDIPTGKVPTVQAPSLGDPRFLALSPGQELMVVEAADGLHRTNVHRGRAVERTVPSVRYGHPDLLHACTVRSVVSGGMPVRRSGIAADWVEPLAAHTLVLPRSDRWNQALTTALLGDWCAPLLTDGFLRDTALGALKAEARTVHRQLVPVWRRRTRHGRVLSLDADLGDGLSLYDLVATDVDLLAHTAGGVFEDERLNTVLRGLEPAERHVVYAYTDGEGATWMEAAAAAGAADPDAFGERVRRKAKRLAKEQARRMAQSRDRR